MKLFVVLLLFLAVFCAVQSRRLTETENRYSNGVLPRTASEDSIDNAGSSTSKRRSDPKNSADDRQNQNIDLPDPNGISEMAVDLSKEFENNENRVPEEPFPEEETSWKRRYGIRVKRKKRSQTYGQNPVTATPGGPTAGGYDDTAEGRRRRLTISIDAKGGYKRKTISSSPPSHNYQQGHSTQGDADYGNTPYNYGQRLNTIDNPDVFSGDILALANELSQVQEQLARLNEAVLLQGAVHIKTAERLESTLIAHSKMSIKQNKDTKRLLRRLKRSCCQCQGRGGGEGVGGGARGNGVAAATSRGGKKRNRTADGSEEKSVSAATRGMPSMRRTRKPTDASTMSVVTTGTPSVDGVPVMTTVITPLTAGMTTSKITSTTREAVSLATTTNKPAAHDVTTAEEEDKREDEEEEEEEDSSSSSSSSSEEEEDEEDDEREEEEDDGDSSSEEESEEVSKEKGSEEESKGDKSGDRETRHKHKKGKDSARNKNKENSDKNVSSKDAQNALKDIFTTGEPQKKSRHASGGEDDRGDTSSPHLANDDDDFTKRQPDVSADTEKTDNRHKTNTQNKQSGSVSAQQENDGFQMPVNHTSLTDMLDASNTTGTSFPNDVTSADKTTTTQDTDVVIGTQPQKADKTHRKDKDTSQPTAGKTSIHYSYKDAPIVNGGGHKDDEKTKEKKRIKDEKLQMELGISDAEKSSPESSTNQEQRDDILSPSNITGSDTEGTPGTESEHSLSQRTTAASNSASEGYAGESSDGHQTTSLIDTGQGEGEEREDSSPPESDTGEETTDTVSGYHQGPVPYIRPPQTPMPSSTTPVSELPVSTLPAVAATSEPPSTTTTTTVKTTTPSTTSTTSSTTTVPTTSTTTTTPTTTTTTPTTTTTTTTTTSTTTTVEPLTTTPEREVYLEVDLSTGDVDGEDLPGVEWLVRPSLPRRRRRPRRSAPVHNRHDANCEIQGVLKFTFTPPEEAKHKLRHHNKHGHPVTMDGGDGTERRQLLLEMWFRNPRRWVFNLGDSVANNGFSGDGSVQENDCEVQGYGTRFSVYASDKHPNVREKLLYHNGHFIYSKVTLVVSDQMILWNNHRGNSDNIKHFSLFALSGQSDSQGDVNYDVYLGLNRVIDGGYRSGSGLCQVQARWLE